MLDFNHILATPGADIQYFFGDTTTTLVQWQTWTKPRGARMIYIMAVGGGSGGGGDNNPSPGSGGLAIGSPGVGVAGTQGYPGGAGGNGGGGQGSQSSGSVGTSGTANTGGGGGGAFAGNGQTPGLGGSGLVIVRYAV